MADRLAKAFSKGQLDKWAAKKWTTLWLSVPRSGEYSNAAAMWDLVFRQIPAFEFAVGDKLVERSFEQLLKLPRPIYVWPLRDNKMTDLIDA